MSLNFDEYNLLKKEFREKLSWFEQEFDLIFKNKTRHYTREDIKLANEILDKLSETINQYKDEKLLFDVISTLNNIERRYPEFF
jgi:sugar-specific transcriptional regulator TrmB